MSCTHYQPHMQMDSIGLIPFFVPSVLPCRALPQHQARTHTQHTAVLLEGVEPSQEASRVIPLCIRCHLKAARRLGSESTAVMFSSSHSLKCICLAWIRVAALPPGHKDPCRLDDFKPI